MLKNCWLVAVVLLTLLTGCTGGRFSNHSVSNTQRKMIVANKAEVSSVLDKGLTFRVVTSDELIQVNRQDPALTPPACREILARLNARAPYHISEDIRRKRPLKAPNDFRAYKDWSPLPKDISLLSKDSRAILIVKNVPFMGWYQRGRLIGDSYACIGREGEETEVGVYRVLDKDADHVSRSYNNSFGTPAMMPWALRIYDHVWVHAGDVTGPHCSHGCIILPLDPARDAYLWSDMGTLVVVIESLSDLNEAVLQAAKN